MGLLNSIASIAPLVLAPTPLAPLSAATIAQSLISELGSRMLAWVNSMASSSGAGSSSWTERASGFTPDPAELARGGDIYGLRDLASQVSGQFGGTPTQEGELLRALEDFARAAVVQVGGLAGASGDRQVDGLRDALNLAGAADAGEGMEGVVARLEAGTRSLVAANG
jgi:hypothetical protein